MASINKCVLRDDVAKDVIELIRYWAVWLSGLGTALLGTVGVIAKDGVSGDAPKVTLVSTIIGIAISLVASHLVLSSLPYLRTHLRPGESAENDIWESPIYEGRLSFIVLRNLMKLQIASWLIAISAFCIFIILHF